MTCYDCVVSAAGRLVPPAACPTCSEAHVHEVIEDDGQLAVAEGVQHRFPLQVLIPGVGGVDGHGRVSQHGLDTSRRYDHLLLWERQRETNEDFRLAEEAPAASLPAN